MKKQLATIATLVIALCGLALNAQAADNPPQFSIAWSEYPSWSVFGVAHAYKLIDGGAGKLGPIEQKYGIDIVLKEAEYDPTIAMYASGEADAVCITNIDVLNPSFGRKSVMVFPTSTSDKADALIVPRDITTLEQLRGVKVYGLAQSVSEYMWVRNLEIGGEDPAKHNFTNRDPGQAAMIMQQGDNSPIVVWNPFVLETLKRRQDVHILFDSGTIPREIIDAIIVGQDSLDKPGGDKFVLALMDTYYGINKMLADPGKRDDTLVAIGQKFSSLDLATMRVVVQQTKFFATPEAGLDVLAGKRMKEVMDMVVSTWTTRGVLTNKPSVGYGSKTDAPNAQFRLDPTYLERYIKQ